MNLIQGWLIWEKVIKLALIYDSRFDANQLFSNWSPKEILMSFTWIYVIVFSVTSGKNIPILYWIFLATFLLNNADIFPSTHTEQCWHFYKTVFHFSYTIFTPLFPYITLSSVFFWSWQDGVEAIIDSCSCGKRMNN